MAALAAAAAAPPAPAAAESGCPHLKGLHTGDGNGIAARSLSAQQRFVVVEVIKFLSGYVRQHFTKEVDAQCALVVSIVSEPGFLVDLLDRDESWNALREFVEALPALHLFVLARGCGLQEALLKLLDAPAVAPPEDIFAAKVAEEHERKVIRHCRGLHLMLLCLEPARHLPAPTQPQPARRSYPHEAAVPVAQTNKRFFAPPHVLDEVALLAQCGGTGAGAAQSWVAAQCGRVFALFDEHLQMQIDAMAVDEDRALEAIADLLSVGLLRWDALQQFALDMSRFLLANYYTEANSTRRVLRLLARFYNQTRRAPSEARAKSVGSLLRVVRDCVSWEDLSFGGALDVLGVVSTALYASVLADSSIPAELVSGTLKRIAEQVVLLHQHRSQIEGVEALGAVLVNATAVMECRGADPAVGKALLPALLALLEREIFAEDADLETLRLLISCFRVLSPMAPLTSAEAAAVAELVTKLADAASKHSDVAENACVVALAVSARPAQGEGFGLNPNAQGFGGDGRLVFFALDEVAGWLSVCGSALPLHALRAAICGRTTSFDKARAPALTVTDAVDDVQSYALHPAAPLLHKQLLLLSAALGAEPAPAVALLSSLPVAGEFARLVEVLHEAPFAVVMEKKVPAPVALSAMFVPQLLRTARALAECGAAPGARLTGTGLDGFVAMLTALYARGHWQALCSAEEWAAVRFLWMTDGPRSVRWPAVLVAATALRLLDGSTRGAPPTLRGIPDVMREALDDTLSAIEMQVCAHDALLRDGATPWSVASAEGSVMAVFRLLREDTCAPAFQRLGAPLAALAESPRALQLLKSVH